MVSHRALKPGEKIRNPSGFEYTVVYQDGEKVFIKEYSPSTPMFYLLRSKCEVIKGAKQNGKKSRKKD